MNKILVSQCLTNSCCRYDGKSQMVPYVQKLVDLGIAIPVCPEQLGGLSTPRIPSERVGEKVLNAQGEDWTCAFQKGAEEALRIAQENQCEVAILKSGSPSCGTHWIYDGTFSGTHTSGKGITAELLNQHHIQVMDEIEGEELYGNLK